MKVGSLFAEIGFKVDDSGLEQFSNALKAFQKQISNGLKDLREYAKAAREISQAMRTAYYVPTQKEAQARYRAETRRLSSQARLTSIRAKQYKQDSDTRASNAASRARQVALKEKGIGRGSSSYSSINNITRALALLSPQSFFSSVGMAIGGLFGPLGAAIGSHIGKMIDKLIGAMFRAATWLGKTILSGMRFGMAYRDYRNFTGRSTTSLGGLMAKTFATSTMNPEDVLKDAARLEREYWDMILGGGNPAFYQLLGVHPTGNGEVDMQNIFRAIQVATGNFSNPGLARSLLAQGGFNEEYLNMHLTKYGGRINADKFLQEAENYERLNVAVRDFEYEMKQIAAAIANEFVRSGLLDQIKQILVDLVRNLPAVSSVFKDLFSVLKSILEWLREMFPSLFGDSKKQIQQDATLRLGNKVIDRMNNGDSLGWAWFKTAFSNPIDANRIMGNTNFGITDLINPASWFRSPFNMMNSIYVNSPEEAAKTARQLSIEMQQEAAANGQMFQAQTNDTFSQAKNQ